MYAIGARHSQTSQLLGKKLVHEKQKHSKTRKEKEELEQRLKLLECNATVNIEGARPKPEDKNSNNAFNIPSALTDENFQTKITHPQAGLKRSREDRDPELLRKKASPILPSLEIFESPEDLQPVVSKKEKPSVSSSHSLRTRNPPTSMPSSIGLDQSSIDSYFKKKSEKPKEKRKSSPSDLKLCIHDFGPIKSIRNEKQDQTKARSLQQLQPPGYLSPPEPEGTLKHTDTILVGEKQGSPLQGKSSWNDCKEPQKENFPPPTKVSLYKEHKPTAVEDKSKIQCEDQEEATELSSNSNEESSDQGAIRDPFLPKQYVEVVRKKAERAKLPGHACEQCKKYYAVMNQWGFGSQQEIANRCSRYGFMGDTHKFH